MTLNKTHPGYDPLGELLALLPPHPYCTRFDYCAQDLGITQFALTSLARQANRAGFKVRVQAKGTMRYVYFAASDSQRAQEWAERYFNAVYCEAGVN